MSEMIKTYQEAVEKIHGMVKFSSKPSLERIRDFLKNLGNPHKKLKYVHVAGTNGKGTTSSFIASCLKEAGYKVGLYTSPYVETFRERFKINDEMISETELINQVDLLMSKCQNFEELNEFEFITALAINWFESKKCDIVVLEVGLGGRFDSTNVIESAEVSVITSVSYDHMHVLGSTLKEIAYEKAGIIKEKSDVVVYPKQQDEVLEVIKAECKKKSAKLFIPNLNIEIVDEDFCGTKAIIDNIELNIPFSGFHQVLNTATALKALEILKKKGYKISDEDIKNGINKTRILARCELISENPTVILDASHNEDGAKALKALLKKHGKDKKAVAIIGMMKDKDVNAYLKEVAPLFSEIITVKPDNPRAVSEEDLKLSVQEHCKNVKSAESIEQAVSQFYDSDFEIGVVCGSVFLAGEIRQKLLERKI